MKKNKPSSNNKRLRKLSRIAVRVAVNPREAPRPLSALDAIRIAEEYLAHQQWDRAAAIAGQLVEDGQLTAEPKLLLLQVALKKPSYRDGLPLAKDLMGLDLPGTAEMELVGNTLRTYGQHDLAIDYLRRAVRKHPASAGLHEQLGKALGDAALLEEAQAELRKAAKLNPKRPAVYLHISVLGDLTGEEIDRLTRGPVDEEQKADVFFALANAFRRRGETEKEMEYLIEANERAAKFHGNWDAGFNDREAASLQQIFDAAWLERTPATPATGRRPVFVVGMPRTGSTLVEQILTVNPDIGTAGETALLEAELIDAGIRKDPGGQWPQILAAFDPQEMAAIASGYFDGISEMFTDSAVFVDKRLDNYRLVPLLSRLFPDARFVHTLRHPMAAIISNYQQCFHDNNFAHSLEHTAIRYRNHLRLMAQWKALLPDRILTVEYEKLVGGLEPEARRLLDFCGVPWSDDVLQFHRSRRAVTTASVAQVRQPLYTDAVDRWRRYEPWLEPARRVLGPLAEGPAAPSPVAATSGSELRSPQRRERLAAARLTVSPAPGEPPQDMSVADAIRFAEDHLERGAAGIAEALCNAVLADTNIDIEPRLVLLRCAIMQARPRRAISLCRELLDSACRDPLVLQLVAMAYRMINRHEDAAALLEQALETSPQAAGLREQLSLLRMDLGDFDVAEAEARRAIAIEPRRTSSWRVLSKLTSLTDSEIAALDHLELPPPERAEALAALATAWRRRGDRDREFQYLDLANAARLDTGPRWNREAEIALAEPMMQLIDADFITRNRLPDDSGRQPVFVFGMPRSGSTLVEQMLASHPDVGTAGETGLLAEVLLERIQARHPGAQWPGVLQTFTGDDFRAIATAYLDGITDIYTPARVFIDKRLGLYQQLGLLSVLFPGARFIHTLRHPLAIVLSCYQQCFPQVVFAHRLEDIAFKYLDHLTIMDYWKSFLGDRILTVQYEENVADFEHAARRLLEFCGLAWHEGVLEFHRGGRAVATASATQVREPVHGAAVDRWRDYERFLEPARQVLGEQV